MNFKKWFIEKLEAWLGIPALRQANTDLSSQLTTHIGESRKATETLATELRTELHQVTTDLSSQLNALGNLLSEASSVSEAQSQRITTVITSVNTSVMEAEERMLIRVTALEERLNSGSYTKGEAEAPSGSGGFVPWTERKRRAEEAASTPDPSKWTKRPTAKKPVPQEK